MPARDAPIVKFAKHLNEISKRVVRLCNMAAFRFQFNCHHKMAKTLPVLSSDYATANLSFSRN